MNDYVIVTDSTANLPEEMINDNELEILSLNYYVDGVEYKGYEKGEEKNLSLFYDMMREKKEVTTSLVSTGDALELLEKIAQAGKDFIYVGFSSGLSGTFQSVYLATEQLKEKYPERKLYAIDSLAAALGEGLLVYYVIENRKKGMSIEENAKWIQENRNHLCHWFTVDDLFFLKRGGRISATTAIVGTALSIKPVLHVDDEGHLIPMMKVRGRKKAIDALVQKMKEHIVNPEGQMIYISHGDCLTEAQMLADKIKAEFPVKEVLVRMLDPVIGAHAGPGTIALFFVGDEK